MTQDLPGDETPAGPDTTDPQPPPDVVYVMPPPAYHAFATISEPGLPPEPPPSCDNHKAIQAVDALSLILNRRLDDLQNLFEREIRAESTREKVVDRLHAELQEYKQDLLLNTLRPVFIDLVQLHDDIGKVALAPPGGESDHLGSLLQGFQQGIEDILYRQGVEPFHVEDDAFDPRRQRAIATIPTIDPAQNKTVAARHRKGFRAGDRVIRPEIVSVYTLKK